MKHEISTIPREKEEGQPTTIPTSGEVLEDGSFLELVREPPGSDKVSLLHWKSGQATVAQEHVLGSRAYVASENAEFLRQLPGKPLPYASTEELFQEVVDFLSGFVTVWDNDKLLLAHFCFASYFYDCVSMSPFLLLCGPSSVDGVSVLQVLACVCRHPVLLAKATVSSLPHELSPTRLICQPNANLESWLPALLFPGLGFVDRGLRRMRGATAVFVGCEKLTTPFADACLSVSLPPQLMSFSIQDEEHQDVPVQKLRNQLLRYRLENFSRVRAAGLDASHFRGSTRELVRTLGTCIVDAPAIQDRLVALLEPREDASRIESATSFRAVIIEALIAACHEQKPSIYVGEITELANGILTRNEETVILRPKQVGAILKHLGLSTTRLDSQGRGIYLLGLGCSRIHRLAEAYGVPAIREGLPGCPHCHPS